MADKILSICGEPIVPGLTLPKAFEELEKQFETIANICTVKGSHETQTASLLLLCHELQRLLRLSFVENGILASRIEILSRYQDECVKKTEKRLRSFETEQKVTRRNLNALRKRQYSYEKVKKSKEKEWWKVDVFSSDYDSLSGLSRISGNPNLEFMLRLNQLLLDFVKDPYTNELLLPPMGSEERAELSKLASLYKLRCRFNKSTQVATSTLIKARQTCVPASGEVDSILNTFTKKQRDGVFDADKIESPPSPKDDKDNDSNSTAVTTAVSSGGGNTKKSTKSSSPQDREIIDKREEEKKKEEELKDNKGKEKPLPSYMLTPVSIMGTPTITLEGDNTPTHIKPLPPPPPPPPEQLRRSSPTSSKLSFDNNSLSLSPSVRVTKLDNRPFVQMLPSGGGGTVLHPLEKSLEASPKVNSASNVPIVTALPTSSTSPSSTYTNLLSSASTTPAALHMALLMQSQQLRALTAAVTAGQTSVPLTSLGVASPTTIPPPIVTTSSYTSSHNTGKSSSSNISSINRSSSSNNNTGNTTSISTVLATPLPKSMSSPGIVAAASNRVATAGTKREGSVTSNSSKRTKARRSGINNEQK